MSDTPADRVTVAKILRSRGRRGEVAAEMFTDFPERLASLKSVYLWDGKNPPHAVAVRECWLHNGRAIFLFEGCDSISEAEKLAGLEIQIPLSERMALPAGTYFVTDLIGCEVFDGNNTAENIGVVRDVQFGGKNVAGTPILAVNTARGELLIPLAAEICTRIDTAARRIEVVLPEGLADLNQA
ncbi:MAG: ribosome maturation factor RimM [Candidatus Acidiferrales bacterium]